MGALRPWKNLPIGLGDFYRCCIRGRALLLIFLCSRECENSQR